MNWRIIPAALVAIVLTTTVTGQTAANNVPGTRAEHDQRAITPNDLKPDACAAISLTAKMSGSGTITGAAASELITGGGGADTMDGGNGNDCLVGGGANDNIRGSGGTDVCIGGLGNDTFHASCETQIQ